MHRIAAYSAASYVLTQNSEAGRVLLRTEHHGRKSERICGTADSSPQSAHSLNVIDETLWFGSGSTLLAVNKNGEVVKKLHIPNSFIYGNITPYKGGILCTGTLHNNERDCSCSYLWLINQEGSIMYSMELGRSPVISSDTSGIWLKDDFAFASCGHDIICFDLKVGKELWRTRLNSDK